MDIHVVRAGETVSSVAARYGVPAGILAGVNGVAPDAPLAVGQTLVIRHPRELHTVASGESVYSIALRYGLSVRTLYQNNPALGGRSALYPGQTLVIAYDDTPTRTLAVNAYSYPFIRGGLLDAALPYLTYLTPFTYGINAARGRMAARRRRTVPHGRAHAPLHAHGGGPLRQRPLHAHLGGSGRAGRSDAEHPRDRAGPALLRTGRGF